MQKSATTAVHSSGHKFHRPFVDDRFNRRPRSRSLPTTVTSILLLFAILSAALGSPPASASNLETSSQNDETDDPARGGPSCQITVAPSQARWGGELKILSRKPGRFGGDQGKVRLHESRSPMSSSTELGVTSWDAESITTRLPSVPPTSQDKQYLISVTRGKKSKACGFLSLASNTNSIQALDPEPCVFTANPRSVTWGDTIELETKLNNFGATTGTVSLSPDVADDHDATRNHVLSQVLWGTGTITVTLPPTRPDELSDTPGYLIAVTRAGAPSPCFNEVLTVLPGVDLPVEVPECGFVPTPPAASWGQRVTLTGAEFGGQGTVRLVAGDVDQVLPIVEWGSNEGTTIVVTLPATRPAQFPAKGDEPEILKLTVTRAGESRACGSTTLVLVEDLILPECSSIPQLVQEGWQIRWEDNEGKSMDAPWPTPPPGQEPTGVVHELTKPTDMSPHFRVEQRSVSGNRLIEALLRPDSGVKIDFGFFAPAGSQRHEFHIEKGKLSFGSLEPSLALQVLPHPEVHPAFLPEDGVPIKDWPIILQANVTVPGCGPVSLKFPILLKQPPLVLPTIAAFFENSHFGGDAIVLIDADDAMVPSSLSLPRRGTTVDACKGDQQEIPRLLGAVQSLANDLALLDGLFHSVPPEFRQLPSVEGIQLFSEMNQALTASGTVAVVAGSGETDLHKVYRSCGWFPPSYGDILSSALILGAPDQAYVRAKQVDWWRGREWTSHFDLGRYPDFRFNRALNDEYDRLEPLRGKVPPEGQLPCDPCLN